MHAPWASAPRVWAPRVSALLALAVLALAFRAGEVRAERRRDVAFTYNRGDLARKGAGRLWASITPPPVRADMDTVTEADAQVYGRSLEGKRRGGLALDHDAGVLSSGAGSSNAHFDSCIGCDLPASKATIISRLFFWWGNELLRKGNERVLQLEVMHLSDT